jgi:hypothetical protein
MTDRDHEQPEREYDTTPEPGERPKGPEPRTKDLPGPSERPDWPEERDLPEPAERPVWP